MDRYDRYTRLTQLQNAVSAYVAANEGVVHANRMKTDTKTELEKQIHGLLDAYDALAAKQPLSGTVYKHPVKIGTRGIAVIACDEPDASFVDHVAVIGLAHDVYSYTVESSDGTNRIVKFNAFIPYVDSGQPILR